MSQLRPHAEAISTILARRVQPRKAISHSPLQTSILQTYRHILREISYLPPSIRKNIREPVVKRFKQNKVSGGHDEKHIKRARQSLRTLRAAHAGDKAAYLGLIFKAFGRSWIRRYELMDQHFLKKGPTDSAQLEEALKQQIDLDIAAARAEESPDATERPPKRRPFQRWDLEKMLDSIHSQKRVERNLGIPTWPRNKLGSANIEASIPEKNIWGKPLSEIVSLTKQAKWWDSKVSRVEPPVEKSEWELLGKLAGGLQETDEAWKIPQRRVPAQQLQQSDNADSQDWDWERYAMKPIQEAEKSKRLDRQLRSGQRPAGPYGRSIESRPPPARWFRRAYKHTWMITPYFDEGAESPELVYKWGGGAPRTKTPSALQMSVFDGVDDTGTLPEAK
ncbi:hypothetical protein CC79DRAFT_1132855 [Sarocladium strictum]